MFSLVASMPIYNGTNVTTSDNSNTKNTGAVVSLSNINDIQYVNRLIAIIKQNNIGIKYKYATLITPRNTTIIIAIIPYLNKSITIYELQYDNTLAPDKYSKCLILLILSFNGAIIRYGDTFINANAHKNNATKLNIIGINCEFMVLRVPKGTREYTWLKDTLMLYCFSKKADNSKLVVAW